MTERFFPEALYEQGFSDLISVIPPEAQLTPSSTIPQAALGKVPGRKLSTGLWAGYNWRSTRPSIDDVRQWALDGANVGLRADHYPGVDIDCTDASYTRMIAKVAREKLGAAPGRTGRAPKQLLMYRTDEPFGKLQLWFTVNGTQHLVEILGKGQQFLVYGTHPTTRQPYTWDADITQRTPSSLTTITREQALAFMDELATLLDILGCPVERAGGDGRVASAQNVDQDDHRAPSIDVLREAVRAIPNTLDDDRDRYIKIGCAIRAAAGPENVDEGFEIFAEWAAKWEGVNAPETVLSDWRGMRGNRTVGWRFLAETARTYGYNDAALDFDVVADAPRPDDVPVVSSKPAYSDQWLAQQIAERQRSILRYSPQRGQYLVWSAGRWRQDAELLAEDIVKESLAQIADKVMRQGITPEQIKASEKLAMKLCSAKQAAAVSGFLRCDRSIAISEEALDRDPWALNTPTGIVDLRSGIVLPPDPDALCTKSTSVPPDFSGACPEWRRFLAEATAGDTELEGYLQRLCGYALTGSTREQHLTFIYGSGGNGKGVFMNVLTGVLGDYARTASMDTFTASNSERHSTDLAMLAGARLVTASETQSGKRWDEARVKSLTGGDPVTARFMRQDFFTYLPQFKLVFAGNHKPEIRNIDRAMKRRIQLVPFDVVPVRVDHDLGAKLREEYPAILAWMIQGCLAWQQQGLQPPERVALATSEYFEDEDNVGRWIAECCENEPTAHTTTQDLFQSWREWANANGEQGVGSLKALAARLIARKYERWKHPETRRMGFTGIRLKTDIGVFT